MFMSISVVENVCENEENNFFVFVITSTLWSGGVLDCRMMRNIRVCQMSCRRVVKIFELCIFVGNPLAP